MCCRCRAVTGCVSVRLLPSSGSVYSANSSGALPCLEEPEILPQNVLRFNDGIILPAVAPALMCHLRSQPLQAFTFKEGTPSVPVNALCGKTWHIFGQWCNAAGCSEW